MMTGGNLETVPEGWGFLRFLADEAGQHRVYVAPSQITEHGLQAGDLVTGQARPPKETEQYHSLVSVETVNGKTI